VFTHREIQVEVPQGSVLPPILYSVHINGTPQVPGVYLALFADDTYMFATDRKEGYVLRKLQRGPNSIVTWCKRWNTKINEDKSQAVYFSYRLRPPEGHLTLKGRNIPFVNHVKYLGVIFDKRITWRLHTEMTEANAFGTFIRVYSIFKGNLLSANMKLTLHKTLIR
jgi:hypothetical protein